jgi:hypothetical protein
LPKSPLRRIQISTKVTIDDAINDVSNNKTQNGDSIINWNRSLYEKKGKFSNIGILKSFASAYIPQT